MLWVLAAAWLAPASAAADMDVVLQIAGAWRSNWGTVVFNVSGAQGSQVFLTGFWQQGPGKTGQITRGLYDAANGQLSFSYYQSWGNLQGTASFSLSPDGQMFMGGYQQPNEQGEWRLYR